MEDKTVTLSYYQPQRYGYWYWYQRWCHRKHSSRVHTWFH